MKVSQTEARNIAERGLVFLSQDDDRLGRFLALTGTGPSEIRDRVEDLAFWGGVLDYLLSDEELLMKFAEGEDLAPELPMMARMALPGASGWD